LTAAPFECRRQAAEPTAAHTDGTRHTPNICNPFSASQRAPGNSRKRLGSQEVLIVCKELAGEPDAYHQKHNT